MEFKIRRAKMYGFTAWDENGELIAAGDLDSCIKVLREAIELSERRRPPPKAPEWGASQS